MVSSAIYQDLVGSAFFHFVILYSFADVRDSSNCLALYKSGTTENKKHQRSEWIIKTLHPDLSEYKTVFGVCVFWAKFDTIDLVFPSYWFDMLCKWSECYASWTHSSNIIPHMKLTTSETGFLKYDIFFRIFASTGNLSRGNLSSSSTKNSV